MSDLDDKLAKWRSTTEAVKPPAELMAQLTALAAAQTAASGVTAAAATKAVAAKGVAAKVWLTLIATGIVAGGVVASRVWEPLLEVRATAPVAVTQPAPPSSVSPAPPTKKTGFLTVRANKPAFVILDGVNLGRAPIVHRTVSVGKHHLLINCLRDGGTYSAGVQRFEVPASTEVDVTNTCVEKFVLADGGMVEGPP